jgi:hypothetical protein
MLAIDHLVLGQEKSYPRKMPFPPTPAKTRPTIKAFMVGAAPQSAEAASKSMMLPMNMYLRSKIAYMDALEEEAS